MIRENNLTKIEDITNIYFRPIMSDKYSDLQLHECDFLLDDIQGLAKCIIQKEVLNKIIKRHCRTSCVQDQSTHGDVGKVCSVDVIDPAWRPLVDLRDVFCVGMIIQARKTFKKERKTVKDVGVLHSIAPGSSTGGDFIKDIMRIDENDIEEYLDLHFSTKSDAHNTKIGIKNNWLEIVEMAKKFNESNVYKQIIEENEAIALHKDRKPQKREITPVDRPKLPGIPDSRFSEKKTSKDRFYIDPWKYVSAINELSNIVDQYICAVEPFSDNYFRPRATMAPLGQYIEELFHVFGHFYQEDIDAVWQIIPGKMLDTLRLLRWDIDENHIL